MPNFTKIHYMLAADIDIYLAKTCKYLDLATSMCFRLDKPLEIFSLSEGGVALDNTVCGPSLWWIMFI